MHPECQGVDHEKYAGEEIPDPWDDDEQNDWQTNRGTLSPPSSQEVVHDGVGED